MDFPFALKKNLDTIPNVSNPSGDFSSVLKAWQFGAENKMACGKTRNAADTSMQILTSGTEGF